MTTTAAQVLACPMDPTTNDAEASSVGGYLTKLLTTVWEEGEGFSGKRPFGNSSWQHDVYAALVREGLVEGKIDEDDYLDACDDRAADKLIAEAIAASVLTAPSN